MTIIDDAPAAVESDAPRHSDAMTDAQKRDAARDLALRDREISGAELAARYGMKAAWGRDQARIARHGARRGQPAKPPAVAPPTYGPPAPATDAPRKLNGTTHTPAPAPVRPSKPVQRKAAAEVPGPLPQPSQALVVVTKLAVAVVATVAAVVSYSHTRDLALAVGQNPMLASLLPLSVDGLVVVGSTSLLIDRQYDRPGSGWAMLAVTVGLAASLAANVVSVDPAVVEVRTVRWVMAAYAPLALAIAGHLLLRMLDTSNRKDTP